MAKVLVAGVGMIPLSKPGASDSYPVMGASAARLALKDFRAELRQGAAIYGDSSAGQRALYDVGMSGILSSM